jgi:hypothetical protein
MLRVKDDQAIDQWNLDGSCAIAKQGGEVIAYQALLAL